MNIEQARRNMVEQQIRPWDVIDQNVLDALYAARREDFVPAAYRNLAFADLEIPLGCGETMLRPQLEGRILQTLALRPTDRVLEVGTGSGFMAALLAARAAHVYTVEIDAELKAFGEANLARNGVRNVTVEQGDAARGWTKRAPYDAIVLTGSVPVLPPELAEQLAPGGRLFAVVGDAPAMTARLITRIADGACNELDLFETSIAPLRNAPQPQRFRF